MTSPARQSPRFLPLALGLCLAVVGPAGAAVPASGGDPPVCAGPALRPAAPAALPIRGAVHALVVFARFADEAGPDETPAFAADLFDADRPGSLTHYFDEMSRGQFALTGEVLPQIYASAQATEAYLSDDGRIGAFGLFTREILGAVDDDVDFGRFDNDGPDGLPNSGDDDGFVDLLLIVMQSTPSGFILGDADGVARLGLDTPFRTEDRAQRFGVIRVREDPAGPSGALQRGRSFADAAGIIAHEVGHLFGLPDLYDRDRRRGAIDEPVDDSAGIGYWGLMGHGARGFDDRGGPTPLSAWSLKRLGWLGSGNGRLAVVPESRSDLTLADVHAGGRVYQVPLGGGPYLLIEHRSSGGSYYDRHLPASGVLIWRVDESREGNNDERAKLVDLVCADGLWADAGYPQGTEPAPDLGRDNLDFYAADDDYRQAHGGNLGDASDVFDGVERAAYTPLSNPAAQGVSVEGIRPVAGGFRFDVVVGDRRRAGTIRASEVWQDTIELVADVTIPPGVRIDLAPGVVVRAADDGRAGGLDPERVELTVQGFLVAASGGVRFESAAPVPRSGDWVGLRGDGGRLLLTGTRIAHTEQALVVRSSEGLTLSGVDIVDNAGDAVRLSDVSGEVTLSGVTIRDAGGRGLAVDGGGRVAATDLSITGSAGAGVERADGGLDLSGSLLRGNGTGLGGRELWLREGASATLSDNLLVGEGDGIVMELIGLTTLEANELRGYAVALRTRSANPRIRANRFVGVDTVLSVRGFRVPAAMQLNVVEAPEVLVVNDSELRLDAARNWWGTAEPAAIAAGMAGPVDWDPPLNFDPTLPVAFALEPNYPNPFNGSTVIEFSVSVLDVSLSAVNRMRLDVRTVTGGLVRRLLEAPAAPGLYRVVWDGRDGQGAAVASGVYYTELSVGQIRLRRRLTVLR